MNVELLFLVNDVAITDFAILEDYVDLPLTRDLRGFTGRSIPTALVICIKCGHVSEHALGALQLLPKVDKKETQK